MRHVDKDESDVIVQLKTRLDRLEAMEAIREGLHRCAKAADRGDIAMLKSCYHPGATEVHWIFTGDAAEFAEFIMPELAPLRVSRHSLSNPIIRLEGDRAFVETQYWGIAMLDTPDHGAGAFVEHHAFGRYLDIWEKRDAQWRIAHRHLTDDGGSTRLMTDQPDVPFNPARSAQPAPADPSYRGFDIVDLCPPPARHEGLAAAVAARVPPAQKR